MDKALPIIKEILERYKDIIQFEEDAEEPPVCTEELIRFNGIDEDGHETFYFSAGKEDFAFCKTARKPYDVVVCECLLVLNHFIPALEINSDGMCGCCEQEENATLPGDCIEHPDGSWGEAIENVSELYGITYAPVISELRGRYFDWELELVEEIKTVNGIVV